MQTVLIISKWSLTTLIYFELRNKKGFAGFIHITDTEFSVENAGR